jgi:hypothetical protein
MRLVDEVAPVGQSLCTNDAASLFRQDSPA